MFLPKFNWQYGISKMVSLNIRRLRELNLCGLFHFGPRVPNMEIRPEHLPPPKKVKFQFCCQQSFTDNNTFLKRSHRVLEGYENWTYTYFSNFGSAGQISIFFIKLLLTVSLTSIWHFHILQFWAQYEGVDTFLNLFQEKFLLLLLRV